MRVCTYCKKEQPLEYYIKHKAECRTCRTAKAVKYRAKEKYRNYSKAYNAEYRSSTEAKQASCEHAAKYRQSEKYKVSRQKYRDLKKHNPEWKLIRSLRSRQHRVMKGTMSTTNGLGCDTSTLKSYLEANWIEGMNWTNYGSGKDKWVIDHILPLSSYERDNQGNWDPNSEYNKRLVHYTNMQPMWFVANAKKGKKIL